MLIDLGLRFGGDELVEGVGVEVLEGQVFSAVLQRGLGFPQEREVIF